MRAQPFDDDSQASIRIAPVEMLIEYPGPTPVGDRYVAARVIDAIDAWARDALPEDAFALAEAADPPRRGLEPDRPAALTLA